MGAGVWQRFAEVILCVMFLPGVDFISCDHPQRYGVVNENVTLCPSNTKPFTDILWKKGKHKAMEWNEKGEHKTYPPFRGRVHLDTTSGNLTIFNLRPEDEDTYEVKFSNHKETFSLKILEPLPHLTLTCSMTGENITFNCQNTKSESGDPKQVIYSWRCSSEVCSEPFRHVIHLKKNSNLSEEVMCIASNAIDERISSISVSSCVSNDGGGAQGGSHQRPDTSDYGHSRYRYALIGGFVSVILIAFVLFLIVLMKHRRNTEKTRCEATEEEVELQRKSPPGNSCGKEENKCQKEGETVYT